MCLRLQPPCLVCPGLSQCHGIVSPCGPGSGSRMFVLGDSDSDCLVRVRTLALPHCVHPGQCQAGLSDNLHPSAAAQASLSAARSTIGLSGLSPGPPGHRARWSGQASRVLVTVLVCRVLCPSARPPSVTRNVRVCALICVRPSLSLRSLYHCLRISTTLSSPTALPSPFLLSIGNCFTHAMN